MALPLSRSTTYTPGAPVKSADLVDIQDSIVVGGHGPVWRTAIPLFTTNGGDGAYVDIDNDGIYATGYVVTALDVRPGDRLLDVYARVRPGALGPSEYMAIRLMHASTAGTVLDIYEVLLDQTSAGTAVVTVPLITTPPYTALRPAPLTAVTLPLDIGADEWLVVRTICTKPEARVLSVSYQVEHPFTP
jgi:hypothetical protein